MAIGLGVTGAFLGTACSVLGMALILLWPLHQELERSGSLHVVGASVRRFRDLAGRAWAPVAGLALLAHPPGDPRDRREAPGKRRRRRLVRGRRGRRRRRSSGSRSGSGLYLLPEAARRTKSGIDARPILVQTLALIGLLALPMVLVYAVAARPLLETVFGESFGPAAGALPWLGMSMALLACAYLRVQYLLALGKARFIVVLGIAAVAEPLLLLLIGAHLRDIAFALFGLQLALAAVITTLSFRSAAHPGPRAGPVAV